MLHEFSMKLDEEFLEFNGNDYPDVKNTCVNLLNNFIMKIKTPEIIFY